MKPIICLGDLTKMPSKERATQNQGIDANLEPYTLAYYHSSVMWAMLLFLVMANLLEVSTQFLSCLS